MTFPSVSRTILPVLAVLAITISAVILLRGQPDRSLAKAPEIPAHAPEGLSGKPVVAGAGVIEPSSEIIGIGTQLSGIMADLYVQPGDQVAKGAALFRIDDRQARATLNEAEAAVRAAEAAMVAARVTLDTAHRQRGLYSGVKDARAIARQEVIDVAGREKDARARLQLAGAERDAAMAARDSARTLLDRHVVRAPIAGEILKINLRPGEFASAGGPGNQQFIEMGSTRPLHVRIDIDENQVSRIRMGAPAWISPRGHAAQRVEARFVRAEPLIVPKTSLTNAATERVDVRVLQLIYALPEDGTGKGKAGGLFVGQQVDAFLPGRDEARP